MRLFVASAISIFGRMPIFFFFFKSQQQQKQLSYSLATIPRISTPWPYDCKPLLLFFLCFQPNIFPPSSSSVPPDQRHSHHDWRKTKLVLGHQCSRDREDRGGSVNISASDTGEATAEPETRGNRRRWSCSVVHNVCFSFGDQGPRVWRKSGEEQNPSVKLPQSVVIRFYRVQSLHSRPAGPSRALPASFCWEAGWRSRLHFPAGRGSCPHGQKYQQLLGWGLCYWAGLTSKLPWYPGPYWESTGPRERGDTAEKKDLGRARSWRPPCQAHWCRQSCRRSTNQALSATGTDLSVGEHLTGKNQSLCWSGVIYTEFCVFIKYKHIIIKMKRNEGMEYFTLCVMNQ